MKRARWIRSTLSAMALAVLALGCGNGVDLEAERAELAALDRAEQAATALGRDLMERLMKEMQSGGPIAAVEVCSEVAQELAASHSRDGLTVRRVSRRARNPADTPDTFERDALGQLQKLDDEGRLPDRWFEVVEDRTGRQLRYLRPIKIMPTCLGCHGPAESIDPEVAQVLASSYPNDQALGYSVGDLRGAISVIVSLD